MNRSIGHKEFEDLYCEYYRPILLHLRRLVDQHEVAEDLSQETFLKAMRAWEQHDQNASVRGWLYRIATNTAYDYLRRQRRIPMFPFTETVVARTSEPHADVHLTQASIWQALNQINELYRVPLLLHLWAGYSIRDIASVLNANVPTVKTRIHRGRKQFHRYYVA